MFKDEARPVSGLYVLEGPDGVGKTTVAGALASYLQTKGHKVKVFAFPGNDDGTLGKCVHAIHHDPQKYDIDSIDPLGLQVLHVAAHVDVIKRQIIPAIEEKNIVILDRYWWSTLLYGSQTGVKATVLKNLLDFEKSVWDGISPLAIFLLKCKTPYKQGVELVEWHEISSAYDILASEERRSGPVITLQNNGSVADIVGTLADVILPQRKQALPCEALPCDVQALLAHEDLFADKKLERIKPLSTWLPTKTTEVFDTYWKFAAERQEIFFRRITQHQGPYTDDGILRAHKFTNAYRASDRVSQYLLRNVIYSGDNSPEEVFFRIILFKTFNKIETWSLLENELGCINYKDFVLKRYDDVLTAAMGRNVSIYSGAYIMPSGGKAFGESFKHRNHLRLIELMMRDEVPYKICDAKSLQHVFELLRSYPMIGDFLAFQYTIDINYSEMISFSERSFVVPGPGAKDGIRKCFSDYGGLSEVDLIKCMADRQEDEFERLGIKFKTLWGRPLQLIDCQNLFCEVDKYARVAHPDIEGISGRSRIKQKFRPTTREIDYFYPPKWHINEKIKAGIIP